MAETRRTTLRVPPALQDRLQAEAERETKAIKVKIGWTTMLMRLATEALDARDKPKRERV